MSILLGIINSVNGVVMKLIIGKFDILEQFYLLSAQLGMKLQAPELIASVADDEERLEPLWKTAAVELAHTLAPYGTYNVGEKGAEYSLELPDNWKSELSSALRECCSNFLLNSLMVQWLYVVNPERAGIYKSMNVECSLAIVEILTKRRKPSGSSDM